MVEIVNVNDEYKQTEEIKAITQEINKTLSHITIATNATNDILFPVKPKKEKRIYCSEDTFINDPVRVSYLGAYNSLVANAQELQEVLEEVDILKKLRLTLALVKKELNKVTDESALDITEKKCIQNDIYFLYEELEAIEKDLELVNIYRPIIENMSNE